MFFGGALESRLAKFLIIPVRTATKRASGGKAANNSTAGRRLGPKKGEGEFVNAGDIVWRQRGTKWFPGENAGIGRDHTIFAREPGYVRYYRDPFHAKRRFIGIALNPSGRLPTPHFEPRVRRFGYTPIDNEEVAQFEKEFLTRKETKRLSAREQILAERAKKQKQRQEGYKQVLAGAGMTETSEKQLARLDSIYQFICGGMAYDEAKTTVDELAMNDFDLEVRVGRLSPEEHRTTISSYKEEAEKVDALVAFGGNRKLASRSSLDTSAREETIERIQGMTEPYLNSTSGTPANIVEEVTKLLTSSSVFSSSDVAHLKSRFLRRPSAILYNSENSKELDERVKKEEGKVVRVWSEESRSTLRYFVPNGGKVFLGKPSA